MEKTISQNISKPHILMLFVDGLGMPSSSSSISPVRDEVCPHLMQLLNTHAKGIDASLGVNGLPQSATGQTAILTGINAAKHLGRHIEGFPNLQLREMIEEHNIFKQVSALGLKTTFANGYLARSTDEVRNMRYKSVTTVATLSALGDVRRLHKLLARQAVAHDLTRETLGSRGYTGSIITECDAAEDVVEIARLHNFTLFEFFLTDHAGHKGNRKHAEAVLQKLDRFLAALRPLLKENNILLLLTSDHGNIEDLSTHTHTLHPVPFVAIGPMASEISSKVNSLTDITAAIIEQLTQCSDRNIIVHRSPSQNSFYKHHPEIPEPGRIRQTLRT
jgi:hypothetical protein